MYYLLIANITILTLLILGAFALIGGTIILTYWLIKRKQLSIFGKIFYFIAMFLYSGTWLWLMSFQEKPYINSTITVVLWMTPLLCTFMLINMISRTTMTNNKVTTVTT